MSPRRRFAAIVVLLLVALVLCVWLSGTRIEQDLLTRSQAALASANIAFYGLDMDGRDALLTGFVASAEDADRVRNVVGSVPGIRAVVDRTVVERIAQPTPAPATPTRGQPPSLRLQRLGSSVFVSGRLPDDGVADRLAAAARDRFGAGAVTGSVQSSAAIASSDWLLAPDRLVELLALASDNVRIVIVGDAGVISGQVASPAAAERLREAAAGLPGIAWRFELFSPRGPLAGGGGR